MNEIINFTKYLKKLNDLAQNVSHENFVMVQKLQADIINSYTSGELKDREERTLYTASVIVMDAMRKELNGDK